MPRETLKRPEESRGNKAEEDIIAFARRLGFEPDEKQEEVLRSNAKRGILNCSRQWGKSTVSAVKAVHRAMTRPGSLVLVACPTARQSGEWVRKAEGLIQKLGIKTRGDGVNAISVLLPNGSRIVGLPGTRAQGGVRGFSAVSMLIVDEAAQMDPAMYKALRPMLATGDGDLWMMSTPFGKQGFFHQTWEAGGEDWHKVRVTGAECGRIKASFLETERKELGTAWFAQEYECSFVDNGMQLFPRALVEGAFTDDVAPLGVTGWTW